LNKRSQPRPPQYTSPGRRALSSTAPGRRALTYRDAGVDIDAGDRLVDRIKPFARGTSRPGVLAGVGGFGALFELARGRYRHPVLVSGTDGVGTKLKLAFELNRHGTVGVDLVAMSVNDILTLGAEPLFFLDYYACGSLDVRTAAEVVKGIALGCKQAGCALIGGETAEMPGMYPAGEYDLAGFAVGVVEKSRIIDGASIAEGDAVLGLASSGAHSNGYSLIRKIVASRGVNLSRKFGGRTLADTLIEPTRIYVKPVLKLLKSVRIKGLAHVTGGGLPDNVPRILADRLAARIERSAWPLPPLFRWLQEQGNVADDELLRVFNCGIGMVAVVRKADVPRSLRLLKSAGVAAWHIGSIVRRPKRGPQVLIV
jgi:phosphoribosylformylglycinamidine cyclo-ligase